MKGEREIAGLRCGEVLERLSDFLDGELSEIERAGVIAHLAGCDTCARFGGQVANAVASLRAALVDEGTVSDADARAALSRLRTRLEHQLGVAD